MPQLFSDFKNVKWTVDHRLDVIHVSLSRQRESGFFLSLNLLPQLSPLSFLSGFYPASCCSLLPRARLSDPPNPHSTTFFSASSPCLSWTTRNVSHSCRSEFLREPLFSHDATVDFPPHPFTSHLTCCVAHSLGAFELTSISLANVVQGSTGPRATTLSLISSVCHTF